MNKAVLFCSKRYLLALFALSVSLAAVVTLPALAADEGDFDSGESNEEAVDSSTTAAIENLGLHGGSTWDIEIDADRDVVYVTAKDSPNGVYHSTDAGSTWEGFSDVDYGGGVAVEVNPDTGTLFAVFTYGLYKSSDSGATFTKLSDDTGSSLAFANDTLLMPSNQSTGSVHIFTADGDSSATAEIDADVYIYWLTESPTSGEFYAVGYDTDNLIHLYRSTDAGSSWAEVTIPSIEDPNQAVHVAVDPTNANYIVLSGGFEGTSYQSTNAGSSWSSIEPQGSGIAFDSTGRVYMGGQYSDDAGSSWSSIGTDENDNSTAIGGQGMAVDPDDTDIVYADGMPGVSKSTDRAATWTDANNGILGVTITDISQATNKDIVWAAAYNGVAKTENFTASSPDWTFPVLPDPATAIWVHPDDTEIVLVGEIGALKRSSDGGDNWAEVASDFLTHDVQVNQLIADVSDTNTLYAAVGNSDPSNDKIGTVLRSTDGGVSWEDLAITDSVSIQTLAQASDGTLYAGVGDATGSGGDIGGIYRYSNDSWTFLNGSPDEEIVRVAVDPHDDTVLYAVASIAYGNDSSELFGFHRSLDGGDSWTQITTGLEQNSQFTSLAIQSSTATTTLYLGAVNFDQQGVLYKSSNQGEDWGLLYTGLKEETFYTLIFDGVTAGTTRGLFEIKSKPQLSLKVTPKKPRAGVKSQFTIQLTDATTGKFLPNKKVQLLRKVGKKFTKLRTVTTAKKGKVVVRLKHPKAKKYSYKARWIPKGDQAEEYVSASSAVKKLTVKAAK